MPIERTPINFQEIEDDDPRYEDAVHALELVADYYEWINSFLGLYTDNPYIAVPQDFDAKRVENLNSQKNFGYERGRDVYQLALLVNSTVREMESEFANQKVLDIGCGKGRFGEAMARNAKAKVTFLDNDRAILDNISPKLGERKLGDGKDLDFIDDEQFDKVITAFSSIYWAETPIESIQALNEAIRVTKIGGSIFILPLFSNTAKMRHVDKAIELAQEQELNVRFIEQRAAYDKVTAAQAYALIRSLLDMSQNGYISITWIDHKGTSINGNEVDNISAVIDKVRPTPPAVLAANLTIAEQFMPR